MFKFQKLLYIHNNEPPQDAWNRYYYERDENSEIPDCNQKENCNVPSEDDKIFVFECSFISLSKSSISVTAGTPKLLHSYCFFDRCSNDNGGGAIYFKCKGSIVQDRFCSVEASTSQSGGIHSYTVLQEYIEKNYIHESCISHCGNENQYETIEMQHGHCSIYRTNFSRNSADTCSGYYMIYPYLCCDIVGSTFENNTAKSHYCLFHGDTTYGKYTIDRCNIVNNKQEGNKYGCISTRAELIVYFSVVHGEYGNGKPFSTETDDAKLRICYCNVDNFEVNKNQGKVETYDNHFENEWILYHLSTKKCYAEKNLINPDDPDHHDFLVDTCSITTKTKQKGTFYIFYAYDQIIVQFSISIMKFS